MLHLLHDLPSEHPLRNLPLRAINAEYRPKGRTKWISAHGMPVADLPYNSIPHVAELFEFRARDETQTDV